MPRPRETLRQRELPYAEAEASAADRKNLLGLALMRVEADLHLSEFVEWVFNVTAGGTHGEMVKSYEEIAARPWGLCCSKATARRTVQRACRLGLVRAEEKVFASLGQKANGYTIDWLGVRRCVDLRTRPGAQFEHPHAQFDHPRAQNEHPFKETTSLKPLLNSGVRSPEAAGADGPETFGADEERETDDEREAGGPRSAHQADALRTALCAEHPELRAAADRRIDPLPARSLRFGVFAPLEQKHLQSATRLAEWFRRQLSVASPVCSDTEADLLLVIAAAHRALGIPERDVRKTRVAVFVAILTRHRWYEALPHLPDACGALRRALERYGDGLLRGTEWPPRGAAETGRSALSVQTARWET